MPWWSEMDRRLTPARLRYAWIAGGALWLAWLLSLLFGAGRFDLAGQVVGTDYLQFYAAGATLERGEEARLYDFEYQNRLQEQIAGKKHGGHFAFTPPFFAWVFVPLCLLPYTLSFAVWSLLGLACLGLSLVSTGARNPVPCFGWALTWFPVIAAVTFGQNSLLSLGLLSLTCLLWRRGRRLAAGMVCSLALYKPQLVLGVGFLWLLEWRRDWRTLAGLALGGAVLVGLSLWLLPESSRHYAELSRKVIPGIARQEAFPLWHAHTPRAFWLLLLPGQPVLDEILSFLSAAAGLVAFLHFRRNLRGETDLLFAGAICLTLWISPHAMIYDWAILLIPAVLLWEKRPDCRGRWKVLFAAIWIATFLGGPLTYGQLRILPFAVQITVPALLFAGLGASRALAEPA